MNHPTPRSDEPPVPTSEDRDSKESLMNHIQSEIDNLWAAYRAELQEKPNLPTGALYARFSTRFQDSILDQVRSLLEFSLRESIFIAREHICFDIAISGAKNRRPGLDQIRTLLASKSVQVFLTFSTNRIFRKTRRTLEFVDEEVVERGLRCIFTSPNIDTARKDEWELHLQLHAIVDEHVRKTGVAHIRSAHLGLSQAGLIFGSLPFGYRGEPVPGRTTKRGLDGRRVAVEPEAAEWVRRIFRMFVREHLTIKEITRRLNESRDLPLRPHSSSGRWTPHVVRYLLANERYRGIWRYGVTETKWLDSKDYARKSLRVEPLHEEHREDLRIVDDELWFDVQHKLLSLAHSGGRRSSEGSRRSYPRVLNGLLHCPIHDRTLQVYGPHGRSMVCKTCQEEPAESRPLYTHLNREVASDECVRPSPLPSRPIVP